MIKQIQIYLILLLLFSDGIYYNNLIAQSITFQKIYGGSSDELGHAVVQTPDSGFITVGPGYSFLRTNKYGDTLFAKRSAATDIIKTSDNNYVTISFNGITKQHINGNIIWQRGQYHIDATIFEIKETINKGFIISGEVDRGTYSLPYILKADSLGYLKWQIVYDTLFNGIASDIVQTSDGGYAFTGNYNQGPYLTKIDSVGNILWIKNYSHILGMGGSTSSIIKLESGYIMCGTAVIIRVDEEGNVIWYKIYLLGSNNATGLNSIIKTYDGGYAVTGERDTTAGFKNVPSLLLLKTDSSGNEQWNRLFGYVDSINGGNVGYDIKQTYDSGFIITGKTCGNTFSCNADLYLVKTDKNGNSPIVNINNLSQIIPNNFLLYQNYPNPFNPVTKINFDITKKSFVELIIHNSLGQEVAKLISQNLIPGKYSVDFNPDHWGNSISSGIYFYTLKSEDFIETKKMLYLK